MQVTKVFFHSVGKDNSKLKAFANVEFDGTLIVKGFKVFEGQHGAFARVPQEKNGEQYFDTVRWSDEQYYKQGAETHPILSAIVEAWNKEGGTTAAPPAKSAPAAGGKATGKDKKQPW